MKVCQPSLHSTYQIVAATGPTPFGVESRRWAIRSGLRQQLRELFKLTPFVEEPEIAQVPIIVRIVRFPGAWRDCLEQAGVPVGTPRSRPQTLPKSQKRETMQES